MYTHTLTHTYTPCTHTYTCTHTHTHTYTHTVSLCHWDFSERGRGERCRERGKGGRGVGWNLMNTVWPGPKWLCKQHQRPLCLWLNGAARLWNGGCYIPSPQKKHLPHANGFPWHLTLQHGTDPPPDRLPSHLWKIVFQAAMLCQACQF